MLPSFAGVITFEEYTGQAEGAITNNHSPSLNAPKHHHPSGTTKKKSVCVTSMRNCRSCQERMENKRG